MKTVNTFLGIATAKLNTQAQEVFVKMEGSVINKSLAQGVAQDYLDAMFGEKYAVAYCSHYIVDGYYVVKFTTKDQLSFG